MSCLERIIMTTQLIPLPAAPPIFMLLFTASLLYNVKPCVYCIVVMGILYLTQSPSSPFSASYIDSSNTTLSTNSSHTNLTSIDTNSTTTRLKYSDPLPDRGWFNWNHGRIFDPVLVGYIPIPASPSDSIPLTSSISADSAVIDNGEVVETKEKTLPPGYIDLRWRGIGFIIDFNWKRTEEGMIYEGFTGQPLPPAPPSTVSSIPADGDMSSNADNKVGEEKKEKDIERRPWFFESHNSNIHGEHNEAETPSLDSEADDKFSIKGQLDRFSAKAIKLRKETQKKVGQLWSPGWKKAKFLEDL